MKRKFTILIAAIAAILMMAQPGKVWGQTQTTVSISSFSATSGTIDSNISYAAYKGNGTSAPIINDNTLRIYKPGANQTDGGYITITAGTNYELNSVTITNSNDKAGTIKYQVGTGSLSNAITFAKQAEYTVNNLTATSVSFYNCGSDRLSIAGFSVTYSSSATPATYTVTFDAGTGTFVGNNDFPNTSNTGVTGGNHTLPTATPPTGYNFDGWTATGITSPVTGTYNVSSNIDFTASYSNANEHTYSFAGANNFYTDANLTTHPSSGSGNNVGTIYYSDGKAFVASGDSRYFSNDNSGYFMLGKSGAKISLPTFSGYKITQVKLHSSTTCSTNVTVSIVTQNSQQQEVTASSGQTWGTQNQDYTYNIGSDYQSSALSVKVTNNYNSQFTSITIVCEQLSNDPIINATTPDALAYNATGGEFGYSITNPTSATLNAVSNADWITNVAVGETTVTFNTSTNTAFTQRTGTITLSYTEANDKVITITQNAAPTPSINAEDVNIAGDATLGSITYTISNPVNGGVLTASTTSTWLTPGVVTNEAVPFTCEANQGAARSATVVLTYTYNTNQTVTKNVTVTQAKAPYTTIPAMFAGATNSNQTVDVIFNNWVVSGVSSNGKNVFVTDNQGNGFVINFSSDQSSTYDVGKILSGTASSCTLKLNNGYAQLTSVSGLTINNGGTVSVVNIALADLSGVHTGALVSYTNLECSVSNTTYTLTDGTTTIQLYTSIYNYTTTPGLVNGKTYNITGIYQQYNNTKEVLPRSTDDIVLKAQMTAPTFNAFTYVVGNTPTAQTAAIAGTDFSGNLTVTVEEGEYEVSNDGSNYGTTATFTKADGGSITSQTLYVKLNSNLSAGDYNGRLSFTADYLDSFDVNLTGSVTANPTYNVVLSQPAGDIATIAADPAYAQSGATITLSYSDVDDCYEFSSWSVMWEDTEMHEITPDANNQFTMPAAEVYVSAVFSQKKFTVDYSVNGSIREALQDVVDCGDEAYMWDEDEMEDEGVTMPTGYEFAGWSTSPASTAVVSSFSPTADATLYAVWAPSGSSSDYVKVTEDLDDWSGEYLIVYEDSENGNKALNGGLTTMDASGNTISVSISIISGNSVIESNSTTDAARVIIASKTNGYSIKSASNLYIGHSGNSNTLNTSSKDDYTNTISLDGSVSIQCGDYKLKYNKASGQERFRYYTSGQQDIQLYKKQTATPYTYIEDITSTTATLPSIEPTYLITVKNGGVLTLTGANNGDETNLIIEDGGQLIILKSDNDPVALTAKKKIVNANSKAPKDHWYTISAPVHTGSNNYVTIGDETTINLTNNGAYDMFAYEESSHTWINQKAYNEVGGFDKMYAGQGYLYRNSGNELSFVGNANFGDVTIDLSYTEDLDVENLKGFNLIGNPYTHSIAKGSSKAIDNTNLSTGCYVLSNSGTWTLITDGNEIKPNQGVLVETSEAVANFQIKDINYVAPAPGKYNNDNIKFMVENAEYSDATYAWFDKGIGLTKISHRNERAPMIYIPQDGHNYAIAIMSDDTKVFGLNFKTATMGQYTLSYKATGEFSYLHVIDRLTGEDVDMLLDGKYTFVATPNDKENRFIVKLSYTPDYSEGDNDIFAYQTGNEILVSGNGELQIFDVTGRQVMTTTINGAESVSVPAQGVYIFRLVGNDIKTQKIVVR